MKFSKLIEKADQVSKQILDTIPNKSSKECDRCGSFYDDNNNKELVLKKMKGGAVNLCPYCQRKLEWWFNYWKRNKEENGEIL